MHNRFVCLLGLSLLLGMLPTPAPGADAPISVPLVAFKREQFENMLWEEDRVQMGKKSVTGLLNGTGAGADSLIAFNLNQEWDLFESEIGYLSSASSGRSCTFEVQADGETLYTSDVIKSGGDEPEHIRVPVKGKKYLILRIHPERYGATAGAAYGNPRLVRGLRDDQLQQSLQLDINGRKTQVVQPGGKAPSEIPLGIPIKVGTFEYRVKVVYDKTGNKATITSEPLTPTP